VALAHGQSYEAALATPTAYLELLADYAASQPL
jgi:hypothetical protein